MAIPTFDRLMRPVVELAAKQPVNLNGATEAMIAQHALSPEDIGHQLPSGGSTIRNRTGWAMTFLRKAALIEKVAPRTYAATPSGRDFLKTHDGRIRESDLRQIPGYEEAWAAGAARRREKHAATEGEKALPLTETTSTPNERIEEAFQELNEALAGELQEHLAKMDPYRFEQLVVDLLSEMGYGGSRKEAARVTQKSNDEGIDGVINEDRLGLDVIYIQAKRWQNDVGRTEIQNFVGALAGQRASKGVFITTSRFNKNAEEYAKSVHQKVILIDGRRLSELMIEHDIGVSTTSTVALKRIDTDYFSEG